MTPAEQIAYKKSLKQFCQSLIEERIAAAKLAIAAAQEAANAAEKSSAGDKYETARAMGHLEKDMHAKQLASYIKELALLNSIDVNKTYSHAAAGACVGTSTALFFIATGLGRHTIDGTLIYFISPQSPLAKQLLHQTKGAQFLLSNTSTTITEVY